VQANALGSAAVHDGGPVSPGELPGLLPGQVHERGPGSRARGTRRHSRTRKSAQQGHSHGPAGHSHGPAGHSHRTLAPAGRTEQTNLEPQ
jgi:hypothetical protein